MQCPHQEEEGMSVGLSPSSRCKESFRPCIKETMGTVGFGGLLDVEEKVYWCKNYFS
jgi:hypothetical protein